MAAIEEIVDKYSVFSCSLYSDPIKMVLEKQANTGKVRHTSLIVYTTDRLFYTVIQKHFQDDYIYNFYSDYSVSHSSKSAHAETDWI